MTTDHEIHCSLPAVSYGRVLFGLGISDEAVEKTREILREVPRLTDIFRNPVLPLKKKYGVIDKVFPVEIRNFLKTVCRYQRMGLLHEIMAVYDRCREEQAGVLNAVLYCVTPPGPEQEEGIKAFLGRKYGAEEVRMKVRRDESLIGGFLLRVGCDEYDWSMKGRMDRLYASLTGR